MGTIIAIVAVGIAAAALVYAHRVNKRQNAALSDVYTCMTKKVCAARDEVRIDFQQQLSTATAELSARLDALENGAIPDYEKAKEAAKAVNDFNSGIAGIFGFDPYDAIRRKGESE